MRDVADQLADWSSSLADSIPPIDRASISSPSQRTESPRRPWVAIAAAVAVVGAGFGAILVLGGGETVDDVPPVDSVAPTTTVAPDDTRPVDTAAPSDSTPPDDDAPPWPILSSSPTPSAEVSVAADPTVVGIAGVPLTDIAVSPSGRFIAENRSEEICVLDTTVGRESPNDGCVAVPGSVGMRSMAWSPDESTIAFNDDAFRFGQEPDITSLDVASGQVTVLTDDGTDDFETGLTDLSPFYGPDGTLYFFRIDPDAGPFSFSLFEFGEPVIELEGLGIEGVPFAGARTDPVTGSVSVLVQEPNDETTESVGTSESVIVTIDLARESVGRSVPGASGIVSFDGGPSFVDLVGGRALLDFGANAVGDGRRGVVVELPDGTASPVPTVGDENRAVSGVGLSPDGTRVVVIVEDLADPSGHRLLVAPVLDDGSIGEVSLVAVGEEFAPNDGDGTIRPQGLGSSREIVWVDDTIRFGLGPNQIVTLELDG